MPYGVSSQMIEAWGPVVFDLSLNKQVRKGDPVRKLDHAAWVDQRDATGLSDDEIAARIGLARPQVTFIRNVLERRVFRTNQYRKLYRLGGGLRWRPDEYVDPEEAYAVRPEAALLRQALAFDRDRVAAWIGGGQWTAETAWHRIARAAHDRPGDAAVRAGNEIVSWAALAEAAEALAGGLAANGVGRGETVAVALQPGSCALVAVAAVWRLGGVVLPLAPGLDEGAAMGLLHKGRVRAVLADPDVVGLADSGIVRLSEMLPALTLLATPTGGSPPLRALRELRAGGDTRRLMPPVGGDPALLLLSHGRLAPHTHQTLLAGARALAAQLGELTDGVVWTGPLDGPGFALALGQWLWTGAPLAFAGDTGLRLSPGGVAGPGRVIDAGGNGDAVHLLSTAECPALLVVRGAGDEWRAVADVELRAGEDGTIEARGPGSAPAYVDDPAATAAAFRPGGWFRTGLAGQVAADGGGAVIDGVSAG